RGTCDLSTTTGLQFDVVHDCADGHRSKLHRVAWLHVNALTRDDHVTGLKALWRENVGKLSVLVLKESDERRAVRIILQALDLGRHIEFAPLEVDDAVALFVASTLPSDGDTTGVVATAERVFAFCKGFERPAFV